MRRKRKNNNNNYLIIALVCLVMLNMGTFLIGVYNNKAKDVEVFLPLLNKGYSSLNYAIYNRINEGLNLKKFFNKFLDLKIFDKMEKAPEINKEPLELDEDNEEEDNIDGFFIEDLELYEPLIIVRDSDGLNFLENIPDSLNLNRIEVNKEKPYILLYHTHATEAFLPLEGDKYHDQNPEKNVIGIGRIISTVLEASGHKVDHVETFHDLPSYSKSYSRSLNTVNKKMEENSNLKISLDLHRDGIEDQATDEAKARFLERCRTIVDGKTVATFSLVVGPDNPNYEELLNFAKYIKLVSDTFYPGLCTGILVKKVGKYNQYVSDYSALIEMGGNLNPIEEVREGGKLVGEILSIAINSLSKE